MINPSEINLAALPWLPLEERASFPKRPAIYFAIDSLGTLQYIGRAVNVRNRWVNHHRYDDIKAIGGVKIAYLFVDLAELLSEIETALIRYFKPTLNNKSRFSRISIDRTRKPVAYRIDDLVIEAVQKAADNQGISANRWVELFLFDSLKSMGIIPSDEQKLGENRGGDRKSSLYKKENDND